MKKKTSDITDSLALVGSQGFGKVDTMEVKTKRLFFIICDNIFNYSGHLYGMAHSTNSLMHNSLSLKQSEHKERMKSE